MKMSTDPKALEMELDALPEGAVVTTRTGTPWTRRDDGRWVSSSGMSRSSAALAESYAPLEYVRDASPEPVPAEPQPRLWRTGPLTAADLSAAHLGRVVEFTVPPEPVMASGLAVPRDSDNVATPTTVKGVLHALEVGHTPARTPWNDAAPYMDGAPGPTYPWVFVNVLGVLPSYAHNRIGTYADSDREDPNAARRAAMFQLPTDLPVTLHD